MKRIAAPTIKAFWELEVRDKDGKVIYKHRQRSHSWVRNAYNLMFCQLAGKDADAGVGEFGAGYLSYKDTGGTIKRGNWTGAITLDATSADAVGNAYRAGAAIDDFGILVGSGTNAESFEDYALQTQIVDGTGSGELSHVEQEAPVDTYTAGTKTWKNELARYFNNNSGGVVTVNELALVDKSRAAAETPFLLMARDKLASAVNIPDTGQLKVTYTIQLVYPA